MTTEADQQTYIQVLTQKWQAAELEVAGLTAHVLTQNRTIESQGELIAKQKEELDQFKIEAAKKSKKKAEGKSE